MANNEMPLVTAEQPIEGELGVLTISDVQIEHQIFATHVYPEENFNADPLLVDVKNILQHTTHIVDNVLQGTQEHLENLEELVTHPCFSSRLSTLKKISSELACKAPGEEIAHKTTMSILNKLSSYSWDAKAVLTLVAFTLDYGDFWGLAQLHSLDQFAKLVGIPKRVPAILKRPDLEKYWKAIDELNNMIKDTLEIIEGTVELRTLFRYYREAVPALSTAMDRIPMVVYWVITTLVACTTQMYCLTRDEDKIQELSPLAQKINITPNLLKMQIKLCHQQKEEVEAYWTNKFEGCKMEECLETPDDIVEVFKALIFAEDHLQPLIDASTNKMVNIDVLKKKDVLLFISGLDISSDDISILNPIYDGIREDDQYKIVWIPIVEQWTDDMRNKFEMLRSKMSWYIVPYFSQGEGIKFSNEEWQLEKPIVVVMNPQGEVENPNALRMIRLWGINAFPFTIAVEKALTPINHRRVAHTYVRGVTGPYAIISKYTFYYGGKDKEWIQQFTNKARIMANDPVIKDARIGIELSHVGKGNKRENYHRILWGLWVCMNPKTFEFDYEAQELKKVLLFLKNKSGWAVLTQGCAVVVSCQGTTILKVLEEFDTWKKNVPEDGFPECFKEHHDKLLQTGNLPSR